MSAISFVRMMGELSGLPRNIALERAHEALFYVGLGEVRYRQMGTFSLGMKQLAKLAQAIVHGPRLLILDEPTNGMDPPARRRMIRMLQEMKNSGQVHLVLCSHLLGDVEEICDEALILNKGRVVQRADLKRERAAPSRVLDLKAKAFSSGYLSALELIGCECLAVQSQRLRLRLPPTMDLCEVYRAAAQCGVQLRRVTFRRDSLEELFLQAMEA